MPAVEASLTEIQSRLAAASETGRSDASPRQKHRNRSYRASTSNRNRLKTRR